MPGVVVHHQGVAGLVALPGAGEGGSRVGGAVGQPGWVVSV